MILRAACAITVTCAVAACSSSTTSGSTIRTVTVTPSSSSSATSSAPPQQSTTSQAAQHQTQLPGTCDSLLSINAVDTAAGTAIIGTTEFVVGAADPVIRRIGYINCRYGVVKGQEPKVEIGVSLYDTPAHATDRIGATADDYTNHGATASPVTVAGHSGQQFTGSTDAGFTGFTVVVASGQRTVAVTVQDVVPNAADAAARIAGLALTQTGG